MTDRTEWTIHYDIMCKILKEVSLEIHPAESDMEYDEEMLRFRKGVEERWLAAKAENPDLVMDIPHDLPG